MKRWMILLLASAFLAVFSMPTASRATTACQASKAESAALREATPRLERANLGPSSFTVHMDLSGHVFLTRAAVADAIIKMLGWTASAKRLEGATGFADVPIDHWAAKQIALAAREGIIRGEPGASFSPNRFATKAEAELMLARALRIAPDLTLESAEAELRRVGIDTALSCESEGRLDYWQFLLLVDRAMSGSLYARFPGEANRS